MPQIDWTKILNDRANTPHARPAATPTIAPAVQALINDVQTSINIFVGVPTNDQVYQPQPANKSQTSQGAGGLPTPDLYNLPRSNVYIDSVLYKWDPERQTWVPIASDNGQDTAGKPGRDFPFSTLNQRTVRLSQNSVKGAAEIIESMKKNGWAGDPIDVVRMPDGGLTTIDNTRVVAAAHAGIDLQALIHPFDEPLPDQMQIDRFTTPKGIPATWGDAITLRIGKQAAAYRNRWPMGSPWTGWDGN